MEVHSTQSVLGWYDNRLRIENRRTYKYEEGNSVTVVERRDITYMLYTDKAVVSVPETKGQTIDKMI